MTAYLITMTVMHALALLITINTKPHAPRSPEPSARALMVVALLHATLLACATSLLWGRL